MQQHIALHVQLMALHHVLHLGILEQLSNVLNIAQ